MPTLLTMAMPTGEYNDTPCVVTQLNGVDVTARQNVTRSCWLVGGAFVVTAMVIVISE
jgi:hypothetical protein